MTISKELPNINVLDIKDFTINRVSILDLLITGKEYFKMLETPTTINKKYEHHLKEFLAPSGINSTDWIEGSFALSQAIKKEKQIQHFLEVAIQQQERIDRLNSLKNITYIE